MRWARAGAEVRGGDDATPAIVERQTARFEPLGEVVPHAHVTLRSDRPVEHLVADLVGLLDRRLELVGAGRASPRAPAV